MEHLEGIGIITIYQIKRPRWDVIKDDYWFTSIDIGLTSMWALFWDKYIGTLNNASINLTNINDSLAWDWNKQSGIVTTKKDSDVVINSLFQPEICWWYNKLWSWNIPQKLKCVFWLLMKNKLLTCKILLNKGWNGPSCCSMCKRNSDSIDHIFISCSFSRSV